MFNPNFNQAPINILPKSVILLLCLIIFIELILQSGEKGLIGDQNSIAWRMELVRKYGFFDSIFEWMRINNTYNVNDLLRFFTFNFIHRSFTEIIFVLVFIAAFGKFTAEVYGDLAFLIIFLLSGAFAALGYGTFLNGTLLIGAYPAVYGVIGAFTWVQFYLQRTKGLSGFQAFHLIIIFMVISLVYNIIYSNNNNEWVAEIIGFITGFFLAIIIMFAKMKPQ